MMIKYSFNFTYQQDQQQQVVTKNKRQKSSNIAPKDQPNKAKQSKKISKKHGKKGKAKSKCQQDIIIDPSVKKLQRGYKLCQNCQTVLNIHKYVCTQCGFIHNMKKHKLDVMKNLSKCTPKIIKSIIQANQFNQIKINLCKKDHDDTGQIKKSKQKSSHSVYIFNNLSNNQQQLGQFLNQNKMKDKLNKTVSLSKQIISFKNIKITNYSTEQLSDSNSLNQKYYFNQPCLVNKQNNNIKTQSKKQNSSSENARNQRQTFSVYKSNYPIFKTQTMSISTFDKKSSIQLQQTNNNPTQFLIFTQSVSKIPISNKTGIQNQIVQTIDQQNQSQLNISLNRNKSYQTKKQSQKQTQQLTKKKKLQQNNIITERAFELNKFHKIGQKYTGKSIINVIKVSQENCNDTQRVIKIVVEQHVENIKAIQNKLAVLTGKKNIILMDVDVDILSNQDNTLINEQRKSSLNTNTIFITGQDYFTAVQWLKLSQKVVQKPVMQKTNNKIISNQNRKQQPSYNKKLNFDRQTITQNYLVTGTLYGHIIIYNINHVNQYFVYRKIVSAHFELINCIKQCPLSSPQNIIFATSSYDGSVKIWDMMQKHPVSLFQVSNRKVQQIHWDSGAKYLIIVRDQGLQNCYLSCFYSVSNRVQLPIMLSQTIDFRLIRNGLLFDTSSSPLVSYPLNSPAVVMLNSRNGVLKILQSEQLRKTSLKRKKSKKNSHQQLFKDYWLRLFKSNNLQNKYNLNNLQIVEMNQSQVVGLMKSINYQENLQQKCNIQEKRCQNINQRNKKNSEVIYSDEEDSVIDQNVIKQGKNIQKNDKNDNPSKFEEKINQRNPDSKNQGSLGLRKSLRVRKPNIQYNFMQHQSPQQITNYKKSLNFNKKQQTKANTKQASHNKKRKSNFKNDIQQDQSSYSKNSGYSQNQQFDDEADFSQNQQEQSGSENSYEHKNKIRQNKSSNNKKKHIKKQAKSNKRSTSQRQIKGKTHIKVNEAKKAHQNRQKQVQNQNQNAYNQIYQQLFYQQTAQQVLNSKKSQYPTNKFPKFSSLTSFYSIVNQYQNTYNPQILNSQQQKKVSIPIKTDKKFKPNKKDKKSNKLSKYDLDISQQMQKIQMQKQSKQIPNRQQIKNQIKQQQSHTQNTIKKSIKYLTTFITSYDGYLIKMVTKLQQTNIQREQTTSNAGKQTKRSKKNINEKQLSSNNEQQSQSQFISDDN